MKGFLILPLGLLKASIITAQQHNVFVLPFPLRSYQINQKRKY